MAKERIVVTEIDKSGISMATYYALLPFVKWANLRGLEGTAISDIHVEMIYQENSDYKILITCDVDLSAEDLSRLKKLMDEDEE